MLLIIQTVMMRMLLVWQSASFMWMQMADGYITVQQQFVTELLFLQVRLRPQMDPIVMMQIANVWQSAVLYVDLDGDG